MKEDLKNLICTWTKKQADVFHDNKFQDAIEDNKYIWKKDINGIYLWKDILAIYFHKRGKIFKISKWNSKEDWQNHCSLYDKTKSESDFHIEIPLEFEEVTELNMGYSVVQRPNFELGQSLFELIFHDGITNEHIINNIIDMKIFHDKVASLGEKFPYPPKQFLDKSGKFWGDIKYWKYSSEDFQKIYRLSLERFIPIFVRDYNIDLDDKLIFREFEQIWKI